MDRLVQILQNIFIRLEGYFSVVFKAVFGFFGSIFGFFAKVFGFNSSGYYLESDAAQTIKRVSEEPAKTEQKTTSETPSFVRRRSQKKVEDYYLNMARDVGKK
ncbi:MULTISPECIES: threonine dehydratase [Nostocales]|uniref:threonine dehydratase n=1 Tax=Nostocales TaxID=1161 RepID=UPI001682F0D1|nr:MULTISPECIES: threonine dehydratase [Nostocales]MBD2298438.1 threonine dehydratase [Nostoc sp. FACHB-190]MBD2488607.1 threonine dehydratase [Aulosira sp. FACHB-615]